MEGLTPGEKIKKLRLNLGLKQDDITNEAVSKSLISMIERNKRGLTWNVANSIAKSFNRYYKNMNKKITAEFLMETEEDRIKKEIKEELSLLKDLIDSENVDKKVMNTLFDKVLISINQLKLKKEKAEFLFLRGEFNYITYDYKEAINDFTEVLVYYIEGKIYSEIANVYNYLGACHQMLMTLDQAINYYVKAYDITVENNTSNREKIWMETTCNLIVCYRKMKRYDLAIHYINRFKGTKCKEQKLYKQINGSIMLLEANTYRDMSNFVKAEQIYNKLLEVKEELTDELLFMTYDNYAILLLDKGRVDSAVNKVSKAYELFDKVKPYNRLGLIFTKSKCYMKSGRLSKLYETLQEGLTLAEEVNHIEMIINFHFAYTQTYIYNMDYGNALNHLGIVEKYIKQYDIKTKVNDLNIFYAEIYCKEGKAEKSVEYMLKVRKDYFDLKNL